MAVSFGTGEYFAKSFAPVSAFPFSVSWCGRLPTGGTSSSTWFNMLTSGAGYLVQMDGSEVHAVFDNETYTGSLGPDLTGDSDWHWFTVVFTATRTYWYADGALITDFAHTQAIDTILALEIGGDSTGITGGPVDVYDLRIHTSQWGLTEHQAYYNSGAGDGAISVDTGNRHLHYKLLDATDPTPEDVSGTHALTLSAGAVDDVANPYSFGTTPTVSSVDTSSIMQGRTYNIGVSGSDFVDGATASFSGTGITVNTTTFNSSSSLTVNITVAGSATTGARDLTITNPGDLSDTLESAVTVAENVGARNFLLLGCG